MYLTYLYNLPGVITYLLLSTLAFGSGPAHGKTRGREFTFSKTVETVVDSSST